MDKAVILNDSLWVTRVKELADNDGISKSWYINREIMENNKDGNTRRR